MEIVVGINTSDLNFKILNLSFFLYKIKKIKQKKVDGAKSLGWMGQNRIIILKLK